MATVDIDRLLGQVMRPSRYSDGEWNVIVKPWESAAVRVLLACPDVYEAGMTNLGVHVLYDILNRQPDVLCQRAFAPWPDMESAMRRQRVPLWSLEARRPAAEFDILAFSVSHELTFSNLANMLDLAGLAALAAQSRETLPLVIAGGYGLSNPEPLADLVDTFVLGDGEEVVLEVVDCLRRWKSAGGNKLELLRSLAGLSGVYVPRFYRPDYTADGAVAAVEPVDTAAAPRPQARRVQALPPPLARPIVPLMEKVQERAVIEIQRGYLQDCGFGARAAFDRPRLERPAAEVIGTARELLASTGYSELALLALRASEHTGIGEIAQRLRQELPQDVCVSLVSMEADRRGVEIAAALAGPRRRPLSLAPQAGSQRLRARLGRPVTDDEIVEAAELALAKGWTNLRLHFLIGLPGETRDDLLAIADLAARVRKAGQRYHGDRVHVRAVVSNFLPRAHTPLQWARQASAGELGEKAEVLRKALKRTGVAASFGSPEQSLLAGILARGDRRLGAVIRRAWEQGARFDGWREHFHWPRWERALAEYKLDPSFCLRERSPDERLPWSHIDMGFDEEELRKAWRRAGEEGAEAPQTTG